MFAGRFFYMFALKELQASDETTSGVLRKNHIVDVAAFGRKERIRKCFSVIVLFFGQRCHWIG